MPWGLGARVIHPEARSHPAANSAMPAEIVVAPRSQDPTVHQRVRFEPDPWALHLELANRGGKYRVKGVRSPVLV